MLFKLDEKIADAKRLHRPGVVIGCKSLALILGNGPALGVYQRIAFAKTGKLYSHPELAALNPVAFLRDMFGYDLAKDPIRTELLKKYTNMFM
ncbi:hypothetical protein KBB27_03010 [Patescibacteria group bacterium]|nr:hypothetical protein [Patescibacteria group bacterium]